MWNIERGSFIWDLRKEIINIEKHGVDFIKATEAFDDNFRQIYLDPKHSGHEQRYFCLGTVEGGVLTVRFTYRNNKIRIIGAGFWRKGRMIYEEEKRK